MQLNTLITLLEKMYIRHGNIEVCLSEEGTLIGFEPIGVFEDDGAIVIEYRTD